MHQNRFRDAREEVQFLQAVRRGNLIGCEPEVWNLIDSDSEEAVEAAIRTLGAAIRSRSFFDEVELIWRNAGDYRSSPALETWCYYYRGTRDPNVLHELYLMIISDRCDIELRRSALMGLFVVWYGKATIELMKLSIQLFSPGHHLDSIELENKMSEIAKRMNIRP